MTATQWFLIALAPGSALFLLGTVGQFNQALVEDRAEPLIG
jgi:hypothetical protein